MRAALPSFGDLSVASFSQREKGSDVSNILHSSSANLLTATGRTYNIAGARRALLHVSLLMAIRYIDG